MQHLLHESPRLKLYRLSSDCYSDRYLSWLNDREVQRYTRRRNRTTSQQDLRDFLTSVEGSKDMHLAIVMKDGEKHIGNLSLNNLDEINKSAEISIMIGDKDEWGKGYAREAIQLVTEVAFDRLHLHRLWAESPNPAFNAMIKEMGWTQEGVRRESMLIEGQCTDVLCWSLLESESVPEQSIERKAPARSFCLLMVDGSPIGLTYAEALLREGLPLSCIILSTEYRIRDLSIATVKERSRDTLHWKLLPEILAEKNIPVYYTTTHNSAFTQEIIRQMHVDVAILGGTGIIKKSTLEAPRLSVINVHPSLLPAYKGCSAVEWALYHHDPVGATCHVVTEEIDAGDIICSGTVGMIPGDLYHDVRRKAYMLQSEVLTKGARILMQPDFQSHIQPNVGGTYYKTMPAETVEQVKQMLVRGKYK